MQKHDGRMTLVLFISVLFLPGKHVVILALQHKCHAALRANSRSIGDDVRMHRTAIRWHGIFQEVMNHTSDYIIT